MADMKKLMEFRQLSLNSDKTRSSKLRFPLGKQISEDICDKWFRKDLEFHVNFKKPAVKQAWVDPIENIKNELVIKKIDKNRPRSERKLLQQSSLDFTKRLQENLKSSEERCNIKIILGQNSLDFSEKYNNFTKDKADEQPKLIKYLPPALASSNKNTFKIKKSSKTKDTNPSDTLWPVPTKPEIQPNTVYSFSHVATRESSLECNNSGDMKPIASVLISPATAAVKRELFQKRTNLAFNETVDNSDKQKPRRPLVRSLSAPCKPEYIKSKKTHERSKKIFLKTPKKTNNKNKESPKSPTDANQSPVVQGKDVVTMVSLVSPAGSDCEEDLIEEMSANPKKIATELKSASKVSSLSKTTKTVSFQQSSIHAIRSFSASFPARRASGSKVQEKRATNSRKPDDDERMPKRRLVRNKENSKTANSNQPNKMEPVQTGGASTSNNSNVFKNPSTEDDCEIQQIEHDEGSSKESGSKQKKYEKDEIATDRNLKSDKEIQCWDMYCKMTEKGINVSFETILKGILTPTEYRLSKKHSATPVNNEPLDST